MSLEVKTHEPSVIESSPALAVVPPQAQSALWRRRRYQVSAALVILALIAAFVANNFLSRQYSPEGAANQYLSAIQAGQADVVWNVIQPPASDPSMTTLTDKAALMAALAGGRPDIKSFVITATRMVDSNSATVDVSYNTSSGTKQGTLLVQRSGANHLGIYPSWLVAVGSVDMEIIQPAGSAGVSLDGKQLAVSAGKADIAVLPLAHKIQFAGSTMLQPQTVTVDLFDGVPVQVLYQPKLTAAGIDKATAAIKAAFDACAQQTAMSPSGCPQTVDGIGLTGQWAVLNDPAQSVRFASDADGHLVATGHFLMKFGFTQPGMDGTAWTVSGGDFQAALVASESDISIKALQTTTGLPALTRPAAATDDAAKAIAAAGIRACAAVSSGNPADCPQGWPFPGGTNFSWTLNGDPMAGATVDFNQDSGLFTVQGHFSMTAHYSIAGYAVYSHDSPTTTYNALLYWDGQKLVLITIAGS
jgi:hypothetical protein